MRSQEVSRRSLVLGGLGLAGTAALAACTGTPAHDGMAMGSGRPIGPVPPASPSPGQRVVTADLTAQPATVDVGGRAVATWTYGTQVPGPMIRATAGDFLRVTLDNRLPADTTVHWHGIRLRNAADGVPGVTQDPVAPGGRFVYEFTAPDPGTYFLHPHVGVQLDRGLYAPLVVDDPHEPGRYDHEWVLVLDDWIDGTGSTPDEVLARLRVDGTSMGATHGGHPSMGMGGGGMSMGPAPWGDAGDVAYPLYLINGRSPVDPVTFTGSPGQRARLRVINAASDTVFAVALGGHRLTVTHTDGYAVAPTEAGAVYLGMGERYDAVVTLGDGVFPLVAAPFGKTGRALALVRTGPGSAPGADVAPAELSGDVLVGSSLRPAESARLPQRSPDAAARLTLTGQMRPYQWGINGSAYGTNTPLTVRAGQRLRITVTNMTMMTHPVHVHGHTFALVDSGLRKDTVLLGPMQSRAVDLEADNPGDWMAHCHNAYHAEAGMMILLRYQ